MTGTANFRNPNYHSPNDTLGTINFDFMTNVVKAAVATLAEEAEIQNSSFAIDSIDILINSTNEIDACKIQISPNPVDDVLHLNSDNCGQELTTLTIYNLQGQLMAEKDFYANLAISVDTKDWTKGVYLLKTATGVKRFLRQ
ncbi:MAG: hypothetical protein ACI9XO_004271 [Paraglaciecola sp.]